MKIAFLFPGQGSQKVGMVHDLYEKYDSVKSLIHEADDTLGFSISKMMFEGPDAELMKTEFTQPAILTASVAVWQVLKENGIEADIAAGHSLGEYSALVAAGALSFADAVHTVHLRGNSCRKLYRSERVLWLLSSDLHLMKSLRSAEMFLPRMHLCRRLISTARDRSSLQVKQAQWKKHAAHLKKPEQEEQSCLKSVLHSIRL